MKLYSLDNQFIKECKNVPRDFTGLGMSVTGAIYWYLNGLFHRIGGPAAEYVDGAKFWYLNGKLHRTDGPAIDHPYGTKEWWLNGKQMSEEQHKLYVDILKLKGLIPNI